MTQWEQHRLPSTGVVYKAIHFPSDIKEEGNTCLPDTVLSSSCRAGVARVTWPPVVTTERYTSRSNSRTRESLRKGLYILLHNSFKQYIWTEVSTRLLNRDLKWFHHGHPSNIRWHWTVSKAGDPSYGTEFHSKTGVFKQGWSVEFSEQGKWRWRS